MKNVIIKIITLGMLTLFACNQNSEQKSIIEKAKMDSIVKVTKQETKEKVEMKFALQDSIRRIKTDKDTMEIHLTNAKGDLAVANDKMGKIKEWQLNRTPDEREKQIKKQTIRIDNLEKKIKSLETAIQIAEEDIKKFDSELKKYSR